MRFFRLCRSAFGWVPLSAAGLLALPALLWLRQSYGVTRQDGILFVLSTGGLALLALFALLVLLTALWLRFRPRRPAAAVLHLDGQTPTETGFSLGWCGLNPLVKVDVRWENPVGVEAELAGRLERATATVRGRCDEVVRIVRVSDVLGLTAVRFRQRLAQGVRIVPDPGQVHGQLLHQALGAGDELSHPEGKPIGDYLEIRRYGPGDPLKQILWKPFARSGQLLVRTPERAVAASPRTLAYFVAGPADEPSAGVARALIESGALGNDFLFAADGTTAVTAAPVEALEQLIRSAAARGRGGEGLADFLAQGEAHGITACVLFVPARPGPWLGRVTETMSRFRGPFRVLLGVDELTDRGRLGRWLFRPAGGELPTPGDLRQIHDAFAAAGASVAVLRRTTGEPMAESTY